MRVICIGQSLNPSGFPRLEAALARRDGAFVTVLANSQLAAGAEILDLNAGGGPGEAERLRWLARTVRAAHPGLPLALDSASAEALAAAADCPGPLVFNSVTCRDASWQRLLPLARERDAAVILMPLDETGLPLTAEERLRRLERLAGRAQDAGIPSEKIWADCLALPEKTFPDQRAETLCAVKLVRERLRLNTVLGIGNISYGGEDRPGRNAAFLADALAAGLTRPILELRQEETRRVLQAFPTGGKEAI